MSMRAIDVATKGTTLDDELIAHTGRFVEKRFDWNAFPSNAGFEDLARACLLENRAATFGEPTLRIGSLGLTTVPL